MPETKTPTEPLFTGRASETIRRLIEAVPDAMVIADAKGGIVLLNTQAERLFLYDPQELLGQPAEILVPENFRQRHVGTDLNSAPSRAPDRWAPASNFSGAARTAVPSRSKSA
jgi:PAS domain-containing protein